MVEVFKTNIRSHTTAIQIKLELHSLFPDCKINFDLDDCDRILRIESACYIGRKIEETLTKKGYYCEELN